MSQDAEKSRDKETPKGVSPLTGCAPPKEYQWKPGQSGNPSGARSAGWSIIEWFNQLEETPEDELEKIARDKRGKPNKRAAAIRWLDLLAASGEISDFEDYCNGTLSLKELKDAGIPTRLLKKVKAKMRKIPGTDGQTEAEREIELHDKAGQIVDQIIDRTVGRAVSRQEVKLDANADASRLIAELREKAGVNGAEGES